MKENQHIPAVIDFAYEVINLYEENFRLRQELNHYKELDKISIEQIERSNKHTKEMTGIIFKAILDPESTINKGSRAIFENKLKESHK